MTTLTNDQIRQLNMYSTYITPPLHPLFTLKQLQEVDFLSVVQAITGIDNRTVAASYLMRRYGMFASTQFVMLATYDEVWLGELDDLQFAANVEYGNKGISMYIDKIHYVDIEKQPRHLIIHQILKDQIYSLLVEIRKHTSVSPLTLWKMYLVFCCGIMQLCFLNPLLPSKPE